MFNLGAVMGGYMDARRMVELESAQDRINAMRDIEIAKGKREKRELEAQDELDRRVAERLRSNTQAAAAGGVASPPPPSVIPGADGVATAYPVRDQRVEVRPLGAAPPPAAPAGGADQPPTGELPAGQAAASMSPVVNLVNGLPQQPQRQPEDPLRMHRMRLEVANESGNPKLVEYAAGKYLKALSDDVTRIDNETRQRLAPLREKVLTGQLDATAMQQQQGAISAMVTYRAQNLGTLLAASRLFPKSEDVIGAIGAMFPNAGGVGFAEFQVTDRQTGKAVPVTVLVGKDGKPAIGPNGEPAFAIPSELARTAAQSSPLAGMFGKPSVEWQATNTDGGVVLSEKTTPQGQTPRTVTVGGEGGPKPKPADVRAEVKMGIDWLTDQVLSKGALGAIEGLRDEYKDYADWAAAEIDRAVRAGESSGQRAASTVLERIKRNIAAGGKASDLIGAPKAAGQPGQPLSPDAAAVAKKFKF